MLIERLASSLPTLAANTDITISAIAVIPLTYKVTALYWTRTLNVNWSLLNIYTLRWSNSWSRRNISLILIHIASDFTTNYGACDST
jgi:hypothetical protein